MTDLKCNTRFIAFYLPQFYPIPENDKWYGRGFTEWTNVAKARPLFPGHYEPHVPADLGFYDMRNPETIKEQAKMAREYGIDGFCYWHYWFGNGKTLLSEPFQKLVGDKSIDINFCLSWANDTWFGNMWNNRAEKQVLAEQLYPGEEDICSHFYALLPAFKDERYIKVNGKPVFGIHEPTKMPDADFFIRKWRELAVKEGIGDFYFVAKDFYCDNKEKYLNQGFDAVYDMSFLGIHHELSFFNKARLKFERDILHWPTVFNYKKAIKYMLTDADKEDDVIPVILPNWDHSPRTGRNSVIFKNCEPQYFKELVRQVIEINSKKQQDKNIVFIQSWNEWGEGNHMEPDLKYGRGYLEALKEAIDER